jgi:hypothetical protein
LKASSKTSARATELAREAGQSSDKQRSPTTGEYKLAGPSNLPDPKTHAYRKDLADVALAGRAIASHYAEPLARKVIVAASLRPEPSEQSPAIAEIGAGEPFDMLDNNLGWAWGYAGRKRLVGYLKSDALGT